MPHNDFVSSGFYLIDYCYCCSFCYQRKKGYPRLQKHIFKHKKAQNEQKYALHALLTRKKLLSLHKINALVHYYKAKDATIESTHSSTPLLSY